VAQARLLPGRDPVAVTAVQFLAAALTALPVAAVTEGAPPAAAGGAGPVLATAGLVLLGTLAPATLFAYGQARVSAEIAGSFVNLEPLVGVAVGAAVFGDPVGLAQAAGAAAILTGIALGSLPLLRPRPRPPGQAENSTSRVGAARSVSPAGVDHRAPFGEGEGGRDPFGGGGGVVGGHEPRDQVVADRFGVGQPHQGSVPAFDPGVAEDRRHQPGAVLGVEAGGRWTPDLGQLGGVVAAGRGRHQHPAAGEDPIGLADGDGRLGEMVEDVDGHGGVEDAGQERQGCQVGLDDRRRIGGQHGPGGVQTHDPGSQRRRQGRPEGALPAAGVQDPPWPEAGQHLGKVVVQAPGRQVPAGHPRRQPEPLRVLVVVERRRHPGTVSPSPGRAVEARSIMATHAW
jgi:hypothetical protein